MSHSPGRSVVIVVIAIALQVALGARAPALQAQSTETSDLPKCQPFSTFPDLIASPAYSRDNTLFVKGFAPDLHDGFIIYSTDGGFSWTNPTLISHWAIVDVVFSPNYFNDQTIYLADTGNALARSTNSGRSWASIPRPPTEGISSLALTDANTVFLGVGGGPPVSPRNPGSLHAIAPGRRVSRAGGLLAALPGVSPFALPTMGRQASLHRRAPNCAS